MEEIKIEFKELDEFTIDDTREVVVQEVPVYPDVVDLEVIPSKETQVFKEDGMNYGEVKVLGDEDLVASNIKQGVEIFGVTGNVEEMTEEVKQGINEQEEIIATQESTLEEINQVIKDKILVKEKFKPRRITFSGYSGTELDNELANLDTREITSMKEMFYQCTNLTRLDLSNFDTSNVTNMENMFKNCTKLIQLVFGNKFDTSKVTDMSGMFGDCNGFTSLDLNSFNTSNVTDMSNMFSFAQKIEEINLSSWDTSNVTNMGSMFYYCKYLTKLDIRNFTFDKVTSYSSMFGSTKSNSIPNNCLIIVKSEAEKEWVLNARNTLTNVKTVAELEG